MNRLKFALGAQFIISASFQRDLFAYNFRTFCGWGKSLIRRGKANYPLQWIDDTLIL